MGDLIYRGKCWRYGDNLGVDVELLRPRFGEGPFDPKERVMEGVDPEFPKKVRPGDVVVAGKRFAHGQPHMGAFQAFKALGVGVVVESIVRGSYRNAVHVGVPVLRNVSDITRRVNHGDELEVNFTTGEIKDLTTGVSVKAEPIPTLYLDIIQSGGAEEWLKKEVARR